MPRRNPWFGNMEAIRERVLAIMREKLERDGHESESAEWIAHKYIKALSSPAEHSAGVEAETREAFDLREISETPTPLAGESASTLDMRLSVVDGTLGWCLHRHQNTEHNRNLLERDRATLREARRELARLTVEAARLTAENDAGNAHLLSARADLEDATRDKEAALTITGDKISANAITADKISVATLETLAGRPVQGERDLVEHLRRREREILGSYRKAQEEGSDSIEAMEWARLTEVRWALELASSNAETPRTDASEPRSQRKAPTHMLHFVPASYTGEECLPCWFAGRSAPATHKVEEEIADDDPFPARHPLTQYLCCEHFIRMMGVHEPGESARPPAEEPSNG